MKCEMICSKCGYNQFIFTWEWETEEQLTFLMLSHSGIGLQYEDATTKCARCGSTEEPITRDMVDSNE